MSERTFVLNRETQKIELRFEKAEYQALSAADKKELQRAFLFSGQKRAWVSRSTRNPYSAIRVAKLLGFTDGGKVGERASFEEQLNRKAERAIARSERFDHYADNAQLRGGSLQSEFKELAKDWSWLTQPNINSSAGRRFANQRQKVLDRYERGFEEYRKSEYFRERAAVAQATADQAQLRNKTYLNNRIEECKKNIRILEQRIVKAEGHEAWMEDLLERMEAEMDKLAFFENCLEEVGGIEWSKDNVKPGYLAKVRGEFKLVVKANAKTVELQSRHVPYTLKYPYAEIREIQIPEGWTDPAKAPQPKNPFCAGDLLTATNIGGDRVIKGFQVIKATAKNVLIQQVEVKENKPVRDRFISAKQERRAVKQNRDGVWVVNHDTWYLYKV